MFESYRPNTGRQTADLDPIKVVSKRPIHGSAESDFTEFLCMLPMALAWSSPGCDTIFASGFMDDIMLSYLGANGPKSSTTLCLEEVRQVAVPSGRQTITQFYRVHQSAASEGSLPSTINLLYGSKWMADNITAHVCYVC